MRTGREGRDGGGGQAVRETAARKRTQAEPADVNTRRVSARIAEKREEEARQHVNRSGARDCTRKSEHAPAYNSRAHTSDAHHDRGEAGEGGQKRISNMTAALAQEAHGKHPYTLRKRKGRTDTAATQSKEAPQSKHSRTMNTEQSRQEGTRAGSSAQHARLGQLPQEQRSANMRTREEADVETWHVGQREGNMTDHWRCKVFTEGGVLRPEWEKVRHIVMRREGGLRKRSEHDTIWEPDEEGNLERAEWENTTQMLGFVAYHVTDGGVVFIDRVQSHGSARRKGIARMLLTTAIQGRASELQVRKRNMGARRLYEALGYVEAVGGEYIPQNTYKYMKRPEGIVDADKERRDVACISISNASNVPRLTWMWMEHMIEDEDKITRRAAQSILRPRDKNMKYLIAALRTGRSDAVGRDLRMTRIINYSETRPYTRRVDNEEDGVYVDRGRVHTKMKWGWRLYKNMMASFRNE